MYLLGKARREDYASLCPAPSLLLLHKFFCHTKRVTRYKTLSDLTGEAAYCQCQMPHDQLLMHWRETGIVLYQ